MCLGTSFATISTMSPNLKLLLLVAEPNLLKFLSLLLMYTISLATFHRTARCYIPEDKTLYVR
jgi:hypothetical protein